MTNTQLDALAAVARTCTIRAATALNEAQRLLATPAPDTREGLAHLCVAESQAAAAATLLSVCHDSILST